MNVMELLQDKRAEILRIAEEHGARNIRIFGSVARGEANDQSDVGFLVEFELGTSLLTHSSLVVALEELLGCKVDVAPEKTLRERIRKRVISEARPL